MPPTRPSSPNGKTVWSAAPWKATAMAAQLSATTCRMTRRIGGAERVSTSELVRLDPPRAWSVHGIDGPVRAQVDLDVEALTDHRARITIAVDFEGHGIGKLLVPLIVRRQARAEMPDNLTRLKQRLEARPPANPRHDSPN